MGKRNHFLLSCWDVKKVISVPHLYRVLCRMDVFWETVNAAPTTIIMTCHREKRKRKIVLLPPPSFAYFTMPPKIWIPGQASQQAAAKHFTSSNRRQEALSRTCVFVYLSSSFQKKGCRDELLWVTCLRYGALFAVAFITASACLLLLGTVTLP